MEDKVSIGTQRKSYNIFKDGKAKKELETDKRIHFKVHGETEVHSVIFDKEKNSWLCDCKYSTLRSKECSHILAAKLLVGSKD